MAEWSMELSPHREGCGALIAVRNRDWLTPWWHPEEQILPLNRMGRPRGSTRFLVWSCTDTSCGAKLIQRMSDVERALFVEEVIKMLDTPDIAWHRLKRRGARSNS